MKSSDIFSGSHRAAGPLAVAIFAFYLLLTPWTTLWDRDEPRFAQAAVEMVRSGNYLYPTFRGEVRAQKPILIYWLMALSISAFGASEMAVRFWAPVGIGVTSYAAYVIGRRLLTARAGLLAMPIVALNPLAMLEGTAATTDAVLMALITCAVAAFVWRLTSPDTSGQATRLAPAVVFALTLSGALLAKGPVGLLPVLVAGGTLWHLRARAGTRTIALDLVVASAAAAALFTCWAVLANIASDGRFLTEGVRHDIVGRVLSPHEGHGGNPLLWLPFYPAVLVIGLAPWSAYVPAALHALWRRDRPPGDADRVLTWWIAGTFVAFSLAATHLPHYVLPAWPGLSLAIASVLDRALDDRADAPTLRWIARGIPLALVTAVVGFAGVMAVPLVLDVPALIWRAAPIAAVIAATSVPFSRALGQADHARALGVGLTAAILFEASVGLWLLPGVERVKPVPHIAKMIAERTSGSPPVATYGFGEPSLDFYFSRTPRSIESPEMLFDWANAREPGILVTTRAALTEVGQPASLREIGSAAGFNVANGRRIELVALERR